MARAVVAGKRPALGVCVRVSVCERSRVRASVMSAAVVILHGVFLFSVRCFFLAIWCESRRGRLMIITA